MLCGFWGIPEGVGDWYKGTSRENSKKGKSVRFHRKCGRRGGYRMYFIAEMWMRLGHCIRRKKVRDVDF